LKIEYIPFTYISFISTLNPMVLTGANTNMSTYLVFAWQSSIISPQCTKNSGEDAATHTRHSAVHDRRCNYFCILHIARTMNTTPRYKNTYLAILHSAYAFVRGPIADFASNFQKYVYREIALSNIAYSAPS